MGRSGLFSCLLVLMIACCCGMDETEFMKQVTGAFSQTAGASDSKRQAIVKDFGDRFDGKPIQVNSAMVSEVKENVSYKLSWYTFGFVDYTYFKAQEPSKTGTFAIVKTKYQNATVVYRVLLDSPTRIQSFRKGQKVTFTGAIRNGMFLEYVTTVVLADVQIIAEKRLAN